MPCEMHAGRRHLSAAARPLPRRVPIVSDELARTCRGFQFPALSLLWSAIPDIAILMSTLPRTCYRVDRGIAYDGQLVDEYLYTLHRIPSEAALKRFFAYALLVREIAPDSSRAMSFSMSMGPTQYNNHYASPETYDFLSAYLGGRPLLPNVMRIEWNRPTSLSTSVFRSFYVIFGPGLQVLRLRNHDDDDYYEVNLFSERRRNSTSRVPTWWRDRGDFLRMLTRLKERSGARLQELTIGGGPGDTHVTLLISQIFSSGFVHLRKLSLPLGDDGMAVGTSGILHLSSLPLLETVEMTLRLTGPFAWSSNELTAFLNSRNVTIFRAARRLHLTAPTLSLLVNFLACVGSPRCEELVLEVHEDAARRDLDQLFNVISRWHTLQTLVTTMRVSNSSLNDLPSGAPTPPTRDRRQDNLLCAPEPIGKRTLQPLLSMHSLSKVELRIHCPFDINDRLLWYMARAWPTLCTLDLGSRCGWGTLETDIRVGKMPWDETDWKDRAGEVGFDVDIRPREDRGVPEEADIAEEMAGGAHAGENDPAAAEENGVENEGMEPDEGEGHEYEDYRELYRDDLQMGRWDRPLATLYGLVVFVRSCPQLRWLGLALDADITTTVKPSRLLTPPSSGHGWMPLSTLHVGLSPIRDPIAVASFLSDMFPLATKRYATRWKAVDRLIQPFAFVRHQERIWKKPVDRARTWEGRRAQ
ncbi:hypothetical protein C8Q77DRAFT_910397 [Trametes polyzona]|nr:hypothetical protein C8Q77DRAFT_910397 [Trametes polyzona]